MRVCVSICAVRFQCERSALVWHTKCAKSIELHFSCFHLVGFFYPLKKVCRWCKVKLEASCVVE